MKKTFAIFLFDRLLNFAEIFPKTVKNTKKKNKFRYKKIQGVRCPFFSPPTTNHLWFLPCLKHGQRLTTVVQSRNKFPLKKYVFFQFGVKCETLDKIDVNIIKFFLHIIEFELVLHLKNSTKEFNKIWNIAMPLTKDSIIRMW